MSLFTETAERLTGLSSSTSVTSIAATAMERVTNTYLPADAQTALSTGLNVASQLQSGNYLGAARSTLNSLGIPNLEASQAAWWGSEVELFGGLTPKEARAIAEQVIHEKRAKKNLFLVEITSKLNGGSLNMPERFNLFVMDLEYSPFILDGEKVKIGGAAVDMVSGNEAVELSLTTLDDRQGTLKKWFAAHHAAAAARDGTVSEPGKYAIRFRIVHAFCTRELQNKYKGYESLGLFRTANLAVSLSRREDALEELQMTFSQLDTFMRP